MEKLPFYLNNTWDHYYLNNIIFMVSNILEAPRGILKPFHVSMPDLATYQHHTFSLQLHSQLPCQQAYNATS
jgi:hypothetical protein